MSKPPSTDQIDALLSELLDSPEGDRAARLTREAEPAATLEAIAQRGADLAIGDTRRGEAAARLAINLAAGVGGPSLRARCLVSLGHVLNYATRFDEALAALTEASSLARQGADTFAAARASLVSMHSLARMGRMDEALTAGDAAVAGFTAINEPVWRAKSDVNVGVIRRMRDDPAGALAHFDSARVAFADQPAVLAQIESNRAEALLDLGRFEEAELAFSAALSAFTDAGITRAAAIAEGNLADLLGRQGRIELALLHFERARRALESADAPADLARLRTEEAEALAAIGMSAESAAAYQQALPALLGAGLAAESARARVGLARVLQRTGRTEQAATQLDEAIAGFESIPNPTGAARAGAQQARVRLAQGRLTEAASLLDRYAGSLADRPVDSLLAATIQASLQLAACDPAAAIGTLDPAIDRARSLGLRPILVDLLHARATAHRRLANLRSAVDDLLAAIQVAEQVRSVLQADRFRAAAMGQRADLYADCVGALLARAAGSPESAAKDRALALETADRAKARTLMDLVHGRLDLEEHAASNDPSADPSMLRELSQRRADMNAIHWALYAPRDRRLSADTARHLAARLDDHEQRISEIERRLASTRRIADLSAPPVRLAQIQAALRPDESFIEFFAAGGMLGAALVTRTNLHTIAALAPVDEVSDLGERLSLVIDRSVIAMAHRGSHGSALEHPRPALATGPAAPPTPGDPADRLLRRLHSTLVAPLLPYLTGTRRLIIVPHGPLHAIPLHAAVEQGSALIDRFDLAYVPSGAFLCHARSDRVDDRTHAVFGFGGTPLVVGVPDELAPEMGDEAKAVSQTIPGARLLVGPEATFDAFAAAAGNAPLIHLACHGVFAARNPLQTRLRFSDRWVTVRDLLPLALPRSIVVLSGCETGKAGVDRGDEAYGLGRALLAAGASTAVLSLWPVHDRTTRELMISMYQSLFSRYLSGEGESRRADIAGAMAHAQRGLAHRGAHAALWAPFVVLGDSRP